MGRAAEGYFAVQLGAELKLGAGTASCGPTDPTRRSARNPVATTASYRPASARLRRGANYSGRCNLYEEGHIAWIALEPLQVRVAFDLRHSAVALGVGSIQPLESPVRLAPEGIDLGNLVLGCIVVVLDELHERDVLLLPAPQGGR